MDWVMELKGRLAGGLYLHNLRQIVECCERGLKDGTAALPAYVIRSVVADLAREWEGRAVTVEEARQVEETLRPALDEVVGALLRGEPAPALTGALERLVRAWVSL